LPRGKHRELTDPQVKELYELAELQPPRLDHHGSHHQRDRHSHRSSEARRAY
jgi:hypothetical protein